MQYTGQDVAQLVFNVINSRVAHVHVVERSDNGVYKFPSGVFVGVPEEISVKRGFKFLVSFVDFTSFIKWLGSFIPMMAQHAVWVSPPVVWRVENDEAYVIKAELGLLDVFGSPVWCNGLLWEDDKTMRFENTNLSGAV
jgi:hypothetical protein